MNTSTNNDDNSNSFSKFAKNILKSFIFITCILLLVVIKLKLLKLNSTLFRYALFIILSTFLFGIISLIDVNIYNNLILGIGIAIGMKFIDLK